MKRQNTLRKILIASTIFTMLITAASGDFVYGDSNDDLYLGDVDGNSVSIPQQYNNLGGVGDINGDGDAEIMIQIGSGDYNAGHTDVDGNTVDYGFQTYNLGSIGDFDDDGNGEGVVEKDSNDNLVIVESDGTIIRETGLITGNPGPAGDIDGDGVDEVVYTNSSSGYMRYYDYQDDAATTISQCGDRYAVFGKSMKDIDDDGKEEFPVVHASTGCKTDLSKIYVYGDGGDSIMVDTGYPNSTSESPGGSLGPIADLDYDGVLEIAFKDTYANIGSTNEVILAEINNASRETTGITVSSLSGYIKTNQPPVIDHKDVLNFDYTENASLEFNASDPDGTVQNKEIEVYKEGTLYMDNLNELDTVQIDEKYINYTFRFIVTDDNGVTVQEDIELYMDDKFPLLDASDILVADTNSEWETWKASSSNIVIQNGNIVLDGTTGSYTTEKFVVEKSENLTVQIDQTEGIDGLVEVTEYNESTGDVVDTINHSLAYGENIVDVAGVDGEVQIKVTAEVNDTAPDTAYFKVARMSYTGQLDSFSVTTIVTNTKTVIEDATGIFSFNMPDIGSWIPSMPDVGGLVPSMPEIPDFGQFVPSLPEIPNLSDLIPVF